jgi:predicted O-methyltransferase YrrM
MGKNTLELNDSLYDYLLSVSLHEDEVLQALREETRQIDMHIMQISPDQGQFMALLVKLTGAKKILEVGTFTGYSALAMARAMPEEGELVACDISESWTNVAKKYWQQAGVTEKIKLHLAPAEETLKKILKNNAADSFDMAFIDADKKNQWTYYECCLELLRPGGVILVDNVLWNGSVINEKDESEDTEAIRLFNKKIYKDNRVEISMIPVGDGITLARKK